MGILGSLAGLAVSIGAASADDVTGPPVVVKSEFIYEKAPFPSCHASTIEETPSGLVAAWFGGTDEGEPDVAIWVSRLEDGKWTAPMEVGNGIRRGTRYPCWNPVLFQVPDGPLLLFYKVGPNPRLWWGMLTRSDDGGKTWSKPAPLPATLLGPVKNKPILLDDGDTVLCGSSTEHEGWRLHFESFSLSDKGAVCKVVEPDVNPEFGVIQPTILKYGDGRLQALCRSRQNRIVETWSSDGGRTWTEQKATSLPNPNSGIDAVTLDDGTQVLVYNHTTQATGARGKLHVAVSKDGKEWTRVATLEDEDRGAEFSYPAVIQTSDGKLHTTYTWNRKKIKHVVLDPKAFGKGSN